jgi:NAD(P)-dependent dehydrogenase (short-subunit alcohol dehydrogenase family)
MPAALVTGGTSGIGFALARALLDDGYDVTVSSRREEKVNAARDALGDVLAVAADVASEADCERLVAAHRERFGRLDLLVNSAGVGVGGRYEDLAVKHWDLQFGVNVRGLFLMTKLCIPLLRDARGWVVNLASIAGTAPTPGLGVYGDTKAAVIHFTHTLNREVEGDGIRAVALCPGFVDTPMAQWSGIPAAEMIQPQDCVEVVRMLLRLSPHARVPQVVIERVGGDAELPG